MIRKRTPFLFEDDVAGRADPISPASPALEPVEPGTGLGRARLFAVACQIDRVLAACGLQPSNDAKVQGRERGASPFGTSRPQSAAAVRSGSIARSGAGSADDKTSILVETLQACRSGFVSAVAFSMFINILMLTLPLYMLQIFDRVLSSRSEETLVFLTLIAVGALLLLAALNVLRGLVLLRISTWLERRLSGAVLSASVQAATDDPRGATAGGLRDLATVRSLLASPSLYPIMDAPWTPLFLAVLFVLHPVLGWVATFGAALFVALAIVNERFTRRRQQLSADQQAKALRQAEAAIRNAHAVQALGMLSNLRRLWLFSQSAASAMQADARQFHLGIAALSRFIRMLLQICVFGVGALLVIDGQLSLGGIIAGAILVSRALAPVEQALASWRGIKAAWVAFRRIEALLSATAEEEPRMPLPTPSGRLEVKNLSFFHRGVTQPTLRGVSFRLEAGESLGLIGPVAAGKTTLARLLIGSLTPRTGQVLLDGMEVSRWDTADLARHLGYLPQTVELFDGSIRDNIARMGDGDPEAVVAAARLAGVHDMILGLNKGYDTPIDSVGMELSAGQRQRIGLARAVFGAPRLVVLDEPAANLDSAGELALLRAMRKLSLARVTVVVVTHRPNLLNQVDKLLVLQGGRAQRFGARKEVLGKVTGKPPSASLVELAG